MLFTFLLVVQAIVAALLVAVILMQKSEGGGLGAGGSPSGFMSARGAADFLTRSTAILASVFVLLSIILAFLAATNHRAPTIDTSKVPAGGSVPLGNPIPATSGAPASGDPLAAAAAAGAAGNGAAPASNEAVPLAR
jgi:preprotein translocase subunit SecG